MKLALNGQARYPDFTDGYALYRRRSKTEPVDRKTYAKVIKAYCKLLADKLLEEGMIDLPGELGSVAAATITKRAQYRGKKFIGYGKKVDWKNGHYDGKLKAFGLVYLPRRGKNANLRCYGFVANRRLFQKVREHGEGYNCKWKPVVFNEDMV